MRPDIVPCSLIAQLCTGRNKCHLLTAVGPPPGALEGHFFAYQMLFHVMHAACGNNLAPWTLSTALLYHSE